jgi:Predicted membrane protein
LKSTNENHVQLVVGEDSALFSFEQQRIEDWIKFSLATSTVLGVVAYLWFLPPGPHLGDNFLHSVQSIIGTTSPDATIFTMLAIFAVSHSGLAGLRPYAENIVGARVWRVVFATVSLPLALSCISYFVNHSHEGMKLWDLTHVPGVHAACWITNFISFLFLYPSTFNLLEIAAIQEPKLHLWETGIIRITRHPQSIGQIAWCVAHCAWLGSSTAVSASTVLILHHLYSIWHGDRRLERQYPEKFAIVKSRTSVVPFQAILDGRQKLPDHYYNEFLRGPYALVVCGTIVAYFAHPWMMAGASLLKW